MSDNNFGLHHLALSTVIATRFRLLPYFARTAADLELERLLMRATSISSYTSFNKKAAGHLRRVAILLLNLLFNHDSVYRLLGMLNKRRKFLHSVFVAYPASEEYALAYVYPKHRSLMKWSPWPVGLFRQNGLWGIIFVISSVEQDFHSPSNRADLKQLVTRTERIRQLLGASQKTFAGILPGVLFAKRLTRETVEADVTVEAVIRAEQAIRDIVDYPLDTPLIVLGGLGFIGRRLVARLKDRTVYSVDTARGTSVLEQWPEQLVGQPVILINVTKKATLGGYLPLLWPKLILINEVYPEPSSDEITLLMLKGIQVFHIVGVKGAAYPPFPRAYTGGIPCCAGHLDANMQVEVKKLG